MSVDFRAGLKKTGLAPTVTRADTETAQAVAAAAPAPKVALSKPVDAAQSKADDLQAKLAARRAWEGDSADPGPVSPKAPPSQNKTAAGKTSATTKPSSVPQAEDLTARLAAKGNSAAKGASPSSTPAAQKSAPGVVPPAEDLAAKLAKVYIDVCMCVCMYVYMYIYTHTHTHTHTYVYTYIYI